MAADTAYVPRHGIDSNSYQTNAFQMWPIIRHQHAASSHLAVWTKSATVCRSLNTFKIIIILFTSPDVDMVQLDCQIVSSGVSWL